MGVTKSANRRRPNTVSSTASRSYSRSPRVSACSSISAAQQITRPSYGSVSGWQSWGRSALSRSRSEDVSESAVLIEHGKAHPMEQRAPVWRPLLTAAIFLAIWAVRQSQERLQQRSSRTYLILIGLLVGCAALAWGIQRL